MQCSSCGSVFCLRLTLSIHPSTRLFSMPADDVLELPSVLVLGGILEGTASAVLAYLWPCNSSKHRKASYVRIADKFLILPQSDTFLKWLHPDARKVLKDGHGKGVEYMQANIVGSRWIL